MRFGLALAVPLLLAGCLGHYNPGLAGLPADAGWESLPIGAWVLNEGLEPHSIVFCPREQCARPGMAAVVALGGRQGREIEQALAGDPAGIARGFMPADAKRGAAAQKSVTSIARFEDAGARGLLVAISARAKPAKDRSPKAAYVALLYGREGERLLLAFAVSDLPAAARDFAAAAWRSR